MSEWIPVKGRMPSVNTVDNRHEIGETVFALDKNGFRYIGHFEKFKYDNYCAFCGVEVDEYCIDTVMEMINADNITHWMPLPKPPREE